MWSNAAIGARIAIAGRDRMNRARRDFGLDFSPHSKVQTAQMPGHRAGPQRKAAIERDPGQHPALLDRDDAAAQTIGCARRRPRGVNIDVLGAHAQPDRAPRPASKIHRRRAEHLVADRDRRPSAQAGGDLPEQDVVKADKLGDEPVGRRREDRRGGAALHDGAVIVQKDRVAAAACFLPLSVRPEISSRLGTRHRAGLGITEESDALALIVSEETGAISVATAGELEGNVTVERAEERIRRHFGFKGVPVRASAVQKPVHDAAMISGVHKHEDERVGR